MVNETPVKEVISMKQSNIPDDDIIENLKNKGYSYEEISNALTQGDVKTNVEGIPTPPSPATEMQPSIMSEGKKRVPQPAKRLQEERFFSQQPEINMPATNTIQYGRGTDERIEELAEAIINEKWKKMFEEVGDLNVWKEKIKTDIASIKQEILRIESRFNSLQNAMIGKISEYDQGIRGVGTEIRAMEKLLQKIIQPLTMNVKELSRITEKLKK